MALKVNQHPIIKQWLIETGNAILIHDDVEDRANVLGKAWMKLRSLYLLDLD
jgi:predicted NAD-dependent protein-ADP-ribosyltransferase YbiA (DUF1768 family)